MVGARQDQSLPVDDHTAAAADTGLSVFIESLSMIVMPPDPDHARRESNVSVLDLALQRLGLVGRQDSRGIDEIDGRPGVPTLANLGQIFSGDSWPSGQQTAAMSRASRGSAPALSEIP